MIKDLAYYLHCFQKLKRDMKNGGAPHKPVLLLSIIALYEKGIYIDNQIAVLPELVATFKSFWNPLVITNHHPQFTLPFYHMKSEKFYTLVPNFGYEKLLLTNNAVRTLDGLRMSVNYGMLDVELSMLLQNPESREVLKHTLLDTYFPKTQQYFLHQQETDVFPDSSLLKKRSETYKARIEELKEKLSPDSFQEEIFIRNGLFKREIPKIYNYTCAISGMQLSSSQMAVQMVDACHIVPFAQSYDDTLTNGIALCPNLHRAFDRGLISFSDDFRVLVSKHLNENKNSPYNFSQFENSDLLLPVERDFLPAQENLYYHRKRFGF